MDASAGSGPSAAFLPRAFAPKLAALLARWPEAFPSPGPGKLPGKISPLPVSQPRPHATWAEAGAAAGARDCGAGKELPLRPLLFGVGSLARAPAQTLLAILWALAYSGSDGGGNEGGNSGEGGSSGVVGSGVGSPDVPLPPLRSRNELASLFSLAFALTAAADVAIAARNDSGDGGDGAGAGASPPLAAPTVPDSSGCGSGGGGGYGTNAAATTAATAATAAAAGAGGAGDNFALGGTGNGVSGGFESGGDAAAAVAAWRASGQFASWQASPAPEVETNRATRSSLPQPTPQPPPQPRRAPCRRLVLARTHAQRLAEGPFRLLCGYERRPLPADLDERVSSKTICPCVTVARARLSENTGSQCSSACVGAVCVAIARRGEETVDALLFATMLPPNRYLTYVCMPFLPRFLRTLLRGASVRRVCRVGARVGPPAALVPVDVRGGIQMRGGGKGNWHTKRTVLF